MAMHESTMQYLKPTEEQRKAMLAVRVGFATLLKDLDALPDGRYKSLAITALEESAMWANKGITRSSDGTPRDGAKAE